MYGILNVSQNFKHLDYMVKCLLYGHKTIRKFFIQKKDQQINWELLANYYIENNHS